VVKRYGIDQKTVAKWKKRGSVANFLYWNISDLTALVDLRALQMEERKFHETIVRKGATARVIKYLECVVVSRDIEMRMLQANGRFPKRMMRRHSLHPSLCEVIEEAGILISPP